MSSNSTLSLNNDFNAQAHRKHLPLILVGSGKESSTILSSPQDTGIREPRGRVKAYTKRYTVALVAI